MSWQASDTIATSAVFIALCSLVSALYNECATRRHQELSVRPNLNVSFGHRDGGAGWHYESRGLGPAVVRWFEASVDGQPQPDWPSVLRALGASADRSIEFSIPGEGLHLPPGEGPLNLLWARSGPLAQQLQDNHGRVSLSICYCSLYDDCWLTSREINRSCDDPPTLTFSYSGSSGIRVGHFHSISDLQRGKHEGEDLEPEVLLVA